MSKKIKIATNLNTVDHVLQAYKEAIPSNFIKDLIAASEVTELHADFGWFVRLYFLVLHMGRPSRTNYSSKQFDDVINILRDEVPGKPTVLTKEIVARIRELESDERRGYSHEQNLAFLENVVYSISALLMKVPTSASSMFLDYFFYDAMADLSLANSPWQPIDTYVSGELKATATEAWAECQIYPDWLRGEGVLKYQDKVIKVGGDPATWQKSLMELSPVLAVANIMHDTLWVDEAKQPDKYAAFLGFMDQYFSMKLATALVAQQEQFRAAQEKLAHEGQASPELAEMIAKFTGAKQGVVGVVPEGHWLADPAERKEAPFLIGVGVERDNLNYKVAEALRDVFRDVTKNGTLPPETLNPDTFIDRAIIALLGFHTVDGKAMPDAWPDMTNLPPIKSLEEQRAEAVAKALPDGFNDLVKRLPEGLAVAIDLRDPDPAATLAMAAESFLAEVSKPALPVEFIPRWAEYGVIQKAANMGNNETFITVEIKTPQLDLTGVLDIFIVSTYGEIASVELEPSDYNWDPDEDGEYEGNRTVGLTISSTLETGNGDSFYLVNSRAHNREVPEGGLRLELCTFARTGDSAMAAIGVRAPLDIDETAITNIQLVDGEGKSLMCFGDNEFSTRRNGDLINFRIFTVVGIDDQVWQDMKGVWVNQGYAEPEDAGLVEEPDLEIDERDEDEGFPENPLINEFIADREREFGVESDSGDEGIGDGLVESGDEPTRTEVVLGEVRVIEIGGVKPARHWAADIVLASPIREVFDGITEITQVNLLDSTGNILLAVVPDDFSVEVEEDEDQYRIYLAESVVGDWDLTDVVDVVLIGAVPHAPVPLERELLTYALMHSKRPEGYSSFAVRKLVTGIDSNDIAELKSWIDKTYDEMGDTRPKPDPQV